MKLYVFVLGSIFGSFLYCITNRIIDNKSILERSRCEYCNHILSIFDMIPIISYCFNKGKCRYCGHSLQIDYLIYEIITGLSFELIYIKKLEFIYYLILLCLIVIVIYDFRLLVIPNRIILILILIYLTKFNIYSFLNSLLITFILYLFIKTIENIKHKEMMGRGDLKLIFTLGLYLNQYRIIKMLFISCLLGIIFNYKNKDRFAFGPYLCISFLLLTFLNI